jgi:signal transduction histidine kinase
MTAQAGIFRLRLARPAQGSDPAGSDIAVLGQAESLTSDNVGTMMEDREGDIWVGTAMGLDRFRSADVVLEPELAKVPVFGQSLLGASDGDVYVGDTDGVLRIRPHQSAERIVGGVGEAEAICEGPDRAIWVVTAQKIVRLLAGRRTDFERPISRQTVRLCAVDRQNVLWYTASEGLFRLENGTPRLFDIPLDNSHASGALPIAVDQQGNPVLFSSVQSLTRIDFPNHATSTFQRKDAFRNFRTLYARRDDILLGGGFGLGRWRGQQMDFVDPSRAPSLAFVTGMVRTPEDDLWVIGSKGIARIRGDELDRAFDNARAPLDVRLFDHRDGLPAFNVRDGEQDAARGGDGRLWFATTMGVVWLDPSRLASNPTPPPVAISALRAAGVTYRDPRRVSLAAGTSDIEINFAALSLSIPDRVRVRYRLEGVDAKWVDVGMRRQAFYTNLRPGAYRFRVVAANNDGVWNWDGATLDIIIPPTFLQSNWFVFLCMIVAAGLLWLLYSIRVKQVSARVRSDLEVKLAERERIARELHDTLLQGFQGLILRFQSVANRIARDEPLRPEMDQALDRAETLLIEGRDRVRGLRTIPCDLAQAITDSANQLVAEWPASFSLTIEGARRTLHRSVQDEVRKIAEEAMRNAFRHAQAKNIEAVLTYGSGELRFHLRDDGQGLPPEIAETGAREGHFGLPGMRERAQRIGGLLTVSSCPGTGTEIFLSVLGATAYESGLRRWRWPRFLAGQPKD